MIKFKRLQKGKGLLRICEAGVGTKRILSPHDLWNISFQTGKTQVLEDLYEIVAHKARPTQAYGAGPSNIQTARFREKEPFPSFGTFPMLLGSLIVKDTWKEVKSVLRQP